MFFMVCCLGAPQSFLVADSIPFLVQDQGTPHFLRHGGGHCQLSTLCNTCTHVGAWNVHRVHMQTHGAHNMHRDT